MDHLQRLIHAIELHDAEAMRDCFAQGINPSMEFRGEPLLHELTSEYTRSARFRDCVDAFVDAGLQYPEPALLAVLRNDATSLDALVHEDPSLVHRRYSLRCAYTPLREASLLHVAAEFNAVNAAKVLMRQGLGVNITSGLDPLGFGGHTPIFHTVNQNGDQSREMLEFLLEQGADLRITVPGIIWGEGYPWETFIASVNPISYAQMGLLPQMHREEETIADIVSLLIRKAYGIDYRPGNIPNAYLK